MTRSLFAQWLIVRSIWRNELFHILAQGKKTAPLMSKELGNSVLTLSDLLYTKKNVKLYFLLIFILLIYKIY